MADIYNQFKDFKAFEVTFLDKENNLQKIICTVKNIENSRIFLNANNHKNKSIIASVGDELSLHIYTDSGIYSATSKVLIANKGPLNTEYVISYPADSKHSQRREYFRAEIPVEFTLAVVTKDKPEETLTIKSKAKNICGKGLSYISDKAFPDYNSIEVELFFSERNIITAASLVYSKPIMISNRPRFIHAFTFTSISKNNIDFIVKKCFLHQLDLRKKQNN